MVKWAKPTLLLLLLSSSLSTGVTTSSTGSGSGGSTTTRADVQEEILDILALERLSTVLDLRFHRICGRIANLGEDRSPDGLNLGDAGSLDQGLELVGLRGISSASVQWDEARLWECDIR
jgi:hypothetical protein